MFSYIKKAVKNVIALARNRLSNSTQLHKQSFLFSFPIADVDYAFNSVAISEVKKYVKEHINIRLDEIMIHSFCHINYTNNRGRRTNSDMFLEVYQKDNRNIGILFMDTRLEGDDPSLQI